MPSLETEGRVATNYRSQHVQAKHNVSQFVLHTLFQSFSDRLRVTLRRKCRGYRCDMHEKKPLGIRAVTLLTPNRAAINVWIWQEVEQSCPLEYSQGTGRPL